MNVYNRLPRELRDQIYSYLWDDDAIRAINSIVLRPSNDNKPLLPKLPIFVDAKFVGAPVTNEAIEWLYENHEDLGVNGLDLETFSQKCWRHNRERAERREIIR